ncbi:MAG: hypothetical protein KA313_02110 [Pseudarcicella sp.]|nr:hypothetical protein [Pseudarcicella sp.]MBP6409873.1 hypothetical protein [Pseudarcicella sp.]
MKNFIVTALMLFGLTQANAQVFTGTVEVEKANKEGIYTSTNIDEKYIKTSWQTFISKYGKVEAGKSGAYKIQMASMPTLSDAAINLITRVYTQKGRTQVFMAMALSPEEYITGNHAKYPEVEKILNEFLAKANSEEAVRAEEKITEEVTEKHTKVIKTGEKLARGMEDNKKDKERLLKKLEENKLELEKFIIDIDQNKKDALVSLEALNLQKKKLEDTKSKVIK